MAAKSLTAKKAAPAKKDVFVYANPFPKGHDDTKVPARRRSEGLREEGESSRQAHARRGPEGPHGLAHEAMPRRVVPPPAQASAAGRFHPSKTRRPRRTTASWHGAPQERRRLGAVRVPFCQDTGTATVVAWKGSRCGRAPTTPRRSRRGSGRRTRARTSGIRRRPLSTCTTRSTRETTCPRR